MLHRLCLVAPLCNELYDVGAFNTWYHFSNIHTLGSWIVCLLWSFPSRELIKSSTSGYKWHAENSQFLSYEHWLNVYGHELHKYKHSFSVTRRRYLFLTLWNQRAPWGMRTNNIVIASPAVSLTGTEEAVLDAEWGSFPFNLCSLSSISSVDRVRPWKDKQTKYMCNLKILRHINVLYGIYW